MKAVRIEWDTDGDNEALAFLPEEIELPDGMSDEESISDYISEQTGFCLEDMSWQYKLYLK